MRVEREGGTGAWLVGTLVAPSAQGHGLLLLQELWPIRVFSQASCSWRPEGLFGQSFSVTLPFQALTGALAWGLSLLFHWQAHRGRRPLAGVLLCRLAHQALKGTHRVGSYSVVQFLRSLMDQPLSFSCQCWCVGRERSYSDGSSPNV